MVKNHFNIELINYSNTLINQILAQNSQIGMVTKPYLQNRFRLNPTLKEELLSSDSQDQVYQLTILLRENSPLSISKVNGVLSELRMSGQLEQLLKGYGLEKNLPTLKSPDRAF